MKIAIILLVIFIVALIADFLIANEFDAIAKEKGYTESKFFWYCFLFTLAGWLMVAALPNRVEQNKKNWNFGSSVMDDDELPDL